MAEDALPPPPPPVRRRAPDQAHAMAGLLPRSAGFQRLPQATQQRILQELRASEALGTPADLRRGYLGRGEQDTTAAPADQANAPAASGSDGEVNPPKKQQAATETLARRAGALSDEIDFPKFVAGLVHNTFDAIVEASIRQMESFADLVSAVAKPVEDFSRDNVTDNAARDWLVSQYPGDLRLDMQGEGGPQVVPRAAASDDGSEPEPPSWLRDYGLEGEPLTPEMIEQELVPKVRERIGRDRQQMLATLVLLGLNRVIVKDGTISARLQFRAVAGDSSKVDYAVSDDPGGADANWGSRAGSAYALPSTKVSTVGVNAQAETSLAAQLYGEVKINFASETLPLERFADDARRTLLERHARPVAAAPRTAPALPPPAAALPPPAVLPVAAPPPAAVPAAPAAARA